VRGALTFLAAGNLLDANIAVGSGTLKHPMLIVRGMNAEPAVVRFNNTTLTADVDYYASLRAGSNELWLTLNRDLSGASNHLQFLP